MQLEEALEVGVQRLGPRGGHLRAGRRLVEPAQLAPELVAAAVAELLQVGLEGVGERQDRRHLVLVDLEGEPQAVGGLDEPLGEAEGHRQATGVEAGPAGDALQSVGEKRLGDRRLALVAQRYGSHVVREVVPAEKGQRSATRIRAHRIEHQWRKAYGIGVEEGQDQKPLRACGILAELLPPHAAPLGRGEDVAERVAVQQCLPLRQVEALRPFGEIDLQQPLLCLFRFLGAVTVPPQQ